MPYKMHGDILSNRTEAARDTLRAPVREPSSPRRKPSICFVALNAYNLLSGREDIEYTGGAEVQQVRIASWLVRQGYRVSFVTLDHGQPDGIELRGIRVFKAYAREDGIRGLRFIHPRWSGLWAAMSRADADVYYQRGRDSYTGQAGLWCRRHRRRFVFAVASDIDCCPPLYASEPWEDKILYWVGLKCVDAVTAQTTGQWHLLRQNLGIEAVVVRNCGGAFAARVPSEPAPREDRGSLRALWVGRINEEKRLEWLLDVAERCPDIRFEVVGAANRDSAYSSSLQQRAAGIRNVSMCGRVPHADMPEHYLRCHVLCCTSVWEGFPNTFLEAWSLGIPAVSTVDPDGVIAANGLGWVVQDVAGTVDCLRGIIESPERWRAASQAARQYYLANHTPDACLPVFERLLLRVAGCKADPT